MTDTAMDKGPWHVSKDGRDVCSADFTVDASLRIDGDFEGAEHRRRYAEWLAATLNATAPESARKGGQGVE